LADEAERIGVVGIEIDELKVRPPRLELGPCALRVRGDTRDVLAVIECQSDEIREWPRSWFFFISRVYPRDEGP